MCETRREKSKDKFPTSKFTFLTRRDDPNLAAAALASAVRRIVSKMLFGTRISDALAKGEIRDDWSKVPLDELEATVSRTSMRSDFAITSRR
jgi:hypothetical protein